MKTCNVLIEKVWGGLDVPVAMFSILWLLIVGILLASLGIVVNYVENMAEIGT